MEVKQIRVGKMENFSYLLFSKKSDEAVLIDPGWEADKILAESEKHNVKIKNILCTHSHYDHTDVVPYIKKRTGAEVFIHKKEKPIMADALTNAVDNYLEKEQTLKFPGSIKLKVLHTPGHSAGGVSFYGDGKVFTGDTLFVDYCGRADLPGANPVKLFESLKRLRKLPATTLVYPGHNYGRSPMSTIGQEKQNNLFLRVKNARDFKRALKGEILNETL